MKKKQATGSAFGPLGIAALTAALLAAGAGDASAVCVDPTGDDGCATTVQAGVDATPAGGTVDVRAGTYFEAVLIDNTKNGLVLAGEGTKKSILKGLPVETSDLLRIEAADVTVRDLAFENSGQEGIQVSADGVTIRDVRVSAADRRCIDIEGSGATVEDSELIGCGDVGVQIDGANATLRKLDIERLGGTCIEADSFDGGVIEDNKMAFCGDYGIEGEGDDVRIEGNKLRGSPGEECLIFTSSDRVQVLGNSFGMCEGVGNVSGLAPVVEKNKFDGSFNGGLSVDCNGDCTDGRVTGNKFVNIDGGDALDISADEAGLLVEGNQIDDCADRGMDIFGVGVTVRKNKVSGCGSSVDEGIRIRGSGHVVEGNQVSDQQGAGFEVRGDSHTLVGNGAKGNLADGFTLHSTAVGVSLEGNKASGNGGQGFEVTTGATGTILSGNKASKNRFDFCDEGTGTVDDGTNKFKTTGACGVD